MSLESAQMRNPSAKVAKIFRLNESGVKVFVFLRKSRVTYPVLYAEIII